MAELGHAYDDWMQAEVVHDEHVCDWLAIEGGLPVSSGGFESGALVSRRLRGGAIITAVEHFLQPPQDGCTVCVEVLSIRRERGAPEPSRRRLDLWLRNRPGVLRSMPNARWTG